MRIFFCLRACCVGLNCALYLPLEICFVSSSSKDFKSSFKSPNTVEEKLHLIQTMSLSTATLTNGTLNEDHEDEVLRRLNAR